MAFNVSFNLADSIVSALKMYLHIGAILVTSQNIELSMISFHFTKGVFFRKANNIPRLARATVGPKPSRMGGLIITYSAVHRLWIGYQGAFQRPHGICKCKIS